MTRSIDLHQTLATVSTYSEVGRVEDVTGLVIESKGPTAKIGDLCWIYPDGDDRPPLATEVVGFKTGRLMLMPLGEMQSLSPGCLVKNTGYPLRIPIGESIVGRVVDGLGQPLDHKGPIVGTQYLPLTTEAPSPLDRKRITQPLSLGVRAVDGFTTIGQGQRIGIFSGSGVGKSTLLGMMARNTEADLSVIALVGERGREVREFIEESLGEDGLKRSIVVVSTSEQPALLKIKAALVATTIAEHFRAQGKSVLLMLDSLTRVAMALREVGLSIGEPPTSRGYTPSVFAFLPKLLERSGTSEYGSITGLYTVLVEGDDFNEPISDAVRGLLDGHVVLSRELAYQNHFPAVDVLSSISRLMLSITAPEHYQAAGKLRDLMATYKRSEDLITIGAYVRGTSPKVDLAIAMKEAIDDFLKQDVADCMVLEETVQALLALGQQCGS